MTIPLTAKINLGKTVITQGAQSALGLIEIQTALMRHSCGDWGNIPKEDKQANNEAVSSKDGYRVLSSFTSISGKRFWVITENIKNDPITTILLPEEY